MDFKLLRTFRTVASLESFNQAADMLDIAQSTVSEHIKALEAELDAQLFERRGKGISLTRAGELFIRYAQTMIDLDEELRTEIKGSRDAHGTLSVRIPETISTYYLPSAMRLFRLRFPRIEFHLDSCSYYGLNDELRSGKIDLAFLIAGEYQDADLEIQTLREIPLALITYPANPLVGRAFVRPIDLKDEAVFATSSDCSYFKLLQELFAREKLRFSTLFHLNSIGAIKRSVAAGTGMALLSRISVREEISRGELVELPLENGGLSAKALMIRMRHRWRPPMLDAFMDAMGKSLSPSEGAAMGGT